MIKTLLLVSLLGYGVAHANERSISLGEINSIMGAEASLNIRSVKAIPQKYKKLVNGWYSEQISIDEIFKIAAKDSDSWLVNEWMRSAELGTELHSIYLVLRTEDIKNKILSGKGSSSDYFELKKLSSKDPYVEREFNKIINSKGRGVTRVLDDVRLIKNAKRIIDSYNAGYTDYEGLVNKSKGNRYVMNAVKRGINKVHENNASNTTGVIFGPKITIIEEQIYSIP